MIREANLYPKVVEWVEQFLTTRYKGKGWQIRAEDTSRTSVRSFLEKHGLLAYFPEAETFEIAVDVTGVAWKQDRIDLVIIEVKCQRINLQKLSQLLGYARVVRPSYALIVSPAGWSDSIHRLVNHFGRKDILEYMPGRYVVVAQWNMLTNDIRPGSTLLPSHFP